LDAVALAYKYLFLRWLPTVQRAEHQVRQKVDQWLHPFLPAEVGEAGQVIFKIILVVCRFNQGAGQGMGVRIARLIVEEDRRDPVTKILVGLEHLRFVIGSYVMGQVGFVALGYSNAMQGFFINACEGNVGCILKR